LDPNNTQYLARSDW